ncbi:hypothetical protein B0H63DRAFT_433197 [Podospora didyma]|uniref:Monooxygenase n=1 Tax=Podospora didyma TaxID=330526 RepID=A0AAE0TZS7_9PEZI|nr:hypothetical protein B0H63DRAFT_433197 [Podospora didyma]
MTEPNEPSYSQFACIGSGFSAIGLGATLQRWYGISDIRFFERHSDLGGTWFINQYPGCACDVPSALYSFSFECNPSWSRVLPTSNELRAYLRHVAEKYDLPAKMTFGTNVEKCEWVEEKGRWRLTTRDLATEMVSVHECQFLFSGSGHFTTPRTLDVPGTETFEGPVIHSGRWKPEVDLTNKRVVLFGNGCTGAQIVPAIVKKTRHLTQVVRSKHWVLPPVDKKMPAAARWVFTHVPGTMLLQRVICFSVAEIDFLGFSNSKLGVAWRRWRQGQAETYMRQTAPAKYHDLLIPEFELNCKRRIFDSGYLASLHSKNMTLTDDRGVEVLPQGVRMASGKVVDADVIVLANGFNTNAYLSGVDVVGRGGETLGQHFESFGGPEAYNCSALSGFPNFFILLGPNTATGHTSAILAVENSINYALRVLKPVLEGKAAIADLKRPAEGAYVEKIQDALQDTVWTSGCNSWYVRSDKGNRTWNGMSYPWSQGYYWWSSVFPVWKDWSFTGKTGKSTIVKRHRSGLLIAVFATLAVALLAWAQEKPDSLLGSKLLEWFPRSDAIVSRLRVHTAGLLLTAQRLVSSAVSKT